MADDVKFKLIAEDQVSPNANKASKSLGGLNDKAMDITKSFAGVGLGLAAFVGGALEGAGKAEQLQTAFSVMIGDAKTAKDTLASLTQFAATTPFELPEVQEGAKKLLAFGVAAKDLEPTLRSLGDVSAGIGAPIAEIAELYGKAKVQGRLFAEDINQLTGRGIPIIGELAKQFGVSEDKVKGLVENGKIGFPQLEEAFKSMSSEGGQFAGLMEAQSQTFLGQISNLKDGVGQLTVSLGEALLPTVKQIAAGLGEAMKAFSSLSPEMKKTIGEGIALGAALGTLAAAILFLASPIGIATAAVTALIAIYVLLKSQSEVLSYAFTALSLNISKVWTEIQIAVTDGVEQILRSMAQIPGPTQQAFQEAADSAKMLSQELKDNVASINQEMAINEAMHFQKMKTDAEDAIAAQKDKVIALTGEAKTKALAELEILKKDGIQKFGDLKMGSTAELAALRTKALEESATIAGKFVADLSSMVSQGAAALNAQLPVLQAAYNTMKAIFKPITQSITVQMVGAAVSNAVKSVVSKHQAEGGKVNKGSTYMVGENGPELFQAGTSGMIIPNDKLMGGKSGGGTVMNFVFNGTVSSKEVAQEYADEIVRKLQFSSAIV